MSRKVTKGVLQRERILSHSYHMFLDSDYRKVTTRGIAEACGMERSLLHHYYNTKDKIVLDIFISITHSGMQFLHERLDRELLIEGTFYAYSKVFFLALERNNRLINLYRVLLKDAQLITDLIKDAFINGRGFLAYMVPQKEVIGMAMAMGSMAHLLLGRYDGLFQLTVNEAVNMSVDNYYIYQGLSKSKLNAMKMRVDAAIDDQLVDEFIENFEKNFKI